ncbi:MAG: M14 family zinc carboxypeptidase, partial [bacterium]
SEKSALETYSQVKININSPEDIARLQLGDITVEHYLGNLQTGIEVTINQDEIARLKNTGIPYQVMLQDLNLYYENREAPSFLDMQKSYQILSEDNIDAFSFGSMGGYYTYNEVVQKLDSMKIQFPNLITVKQNIGTTAGARTIWAVKISDNPDINESASEPAIYFDALHHAREPQAMAGLMYYMYWLLENYGTNPEATYLLNNREIFFVPVVNPDGYVYNQTTNPNGGGFWRKNRRNNGGCFGVDLNRNYNYGWGINSGSSNDPCSETYRGPSAGSEPETQAIKNFTQQIHPKIAFSTHSVAGRYLNPYGYNDTAVKYEIYSEFSSDFASTNNYLYGTVIEMLQYYSSGTTRDYLHSEGTYCWTPEVGGSGFWPNQSEIIPVANENLYGMKYLSWVGGAFADYLNYKILGNGYVQKNDTLQLQIALKNKGLSQTSKNVTVDLTSSYPNLVALNPAVNYDSIQSRQYKINSSNPFKFKITSAALYMDEMKFIISVKQEGVETSKDTIRINVGKANVLFSDNAENGISKWTRAGNGIQWDTTFIDPYDGSKNFTDSRYGNSKDNTNNTFTLKDTINLTNTNNPRIEFNAKWAEEQTFDYTRIQLSTNFGSTWINLVGRYTRTVSGQPSYSDVKHWRDEQINLNPYIGQKIKIRFNFITDAGVPGDGFYFDNFRVVNYINDVPILTEYNITVIPEGFYNISALALNSKDTARVYLRQTGSPYSIIDSSVAVIDSVTFTGNFHFFNTPSGTYFIVVKHRNAIETWSKAGGEPFISGTLNNYNFTTSFSQAFGNNLKLVGSRYTIFSGDSNQDGVIDIADLSLIDNDVFNLVSGYTATDVNGDNFVDVSDLSVTDNNAYNLISKITPETKPNNIVIEK